MVINGTVVMSRLVWRFAFVEMSAGDSSVTLLVYIVVGTRRSVWIVLHSSILYIHRRIT